jgi:peptidyl-tRNA hydrolase
MYLFLNEGLEMSVGKSCAQIAHAAVEAYRISDTELVKAWYVGKHYTKLVMAARDEQHLKTIQTYLKKRGFKSELTYLNTCCQRYL